MKTLPLSLLLLISLTTGFGPQKLNDQKEQIRKHNIKKVTSMAGISTKQKFVSDYDRRGNLVRKVGYHSNGDQFLEETYQYDDKDNVIESVIDGKKQTYAYKYNSEGKTLEASRFDSAGTLERRTEYILDDAGRVSESLSYSGTGELQAKYVSKRDARGNVIEYSKHGSLLEKRVHRYQRNDTLMLTSIYGPNGELTSRITYEYDGDRLIQQSTYEANGNLLRRNKYRRDQKGVVVEDLQTNEKGQPVDRTTSEYELYS
jgi:hypothetical protein